MSRQARVDSLYQALAAVMNALEAEGERLRPSTVSGYSGVVGESGSIDANKDEGRWVADVKDIDEGEA